MLALAAPLPAFAISELSPSAEGQVAQLSVSTSLGSCGVHETELVCALWVSFEPLPDATGYSATVTRADGSVIDMGAVGAGGAELYVPYVGSGTYSVRVTAYGEPAELDETSDDQTKEEVIATDVAEATANDEAGRGLEAGAAGAVKSEAGPRDDVEGQPAAQPGAALEATASCVDPARVADSTEPEPLPEEPPEDSDPNKPDEDSDGILDEKERIEYDLAVAAREEAAAAAAAQAPADC